MGLCLNIPNKWWPGFLDGGLNRGKIAAITLDPSSSYYFQVELNNEPGAHYAMRYDSNLLYADDKQPGFSRFCLPLCCLGNPEDEVARVQVPQKIGWMVDNDYTDMKDVAVNEETIEFDNRNDDDQENRDDDDCNNNNDDDNNDDVLYSKVTATKKRKKGMRLKQMMSKKRKPKGTTKCNNKSRHNSNTSINHDFVVCGEGDADVEGDADGKESDEDIDLFKEKRYKKTNAANWTKHENGQPGRVIHPIPFTGTSEFFCTNISDIEMKEMIDKHGDVRFHKIFEWMLPTFYSKSFYE